MTQLVVYGIGTTDNGSLSNEFIHYYFVSVHVLEQ